jgi:hypothetical protein
MTRINPSLETFETLNQQEQEAVLFYAEQLRKKFNATHKKEKYQNGLGEMGSIELAMALIKLIGEVKE